MTLPPSGGDPGFDEIVHPPSAPPVDPAALPTMVLPNASAAASRAPRRAFGLGVGVAVAIGGLLAGAAFGAFALGMRGGDPAAPDPSPSPSPTGSPPVIVDTVRLTIPEGFTAADIYERGFEELGIPVEDFEAAAADAEAIGLPPEANGSVEGWLGAFTYQIPENATAADVLAEMIDATLFHLDARDVAPGDRLNVLTRASLIEKEVTLDTDRPKVARVIENRLAADMLLQFDSTVHYVVGATSVFTSDQDRAVDSPYNTYRYKSLPPGPICSPGLPSIEAALSPADGPWLFFVAVNLDTGETAFATTNDEHEANVAILHAWMAANR